MKATITFEWRNIEEPTREDKIKQLKNDNKLKLVMGGDFDASQMALIPISDIFDCKLKTI